MNLGAYIWGDRFEFWHGKPSHLIQNSPMLQGCICGDERRDWPWTIKSCDSPDSSGHETDEAGITRAICVFSNRYHSPTLRTHLSPLFKCVPNALDEITIVFSLALISPSLYPIMYDFLPVESKALELMPCFSLEPPIQADSGSFEVLQLGSGEATLSSLLCC